MIDFSDLDSKLTAKNTAKLDEKAIQERASIVNGGETTYEQITCPKCNGRGSRVYGYVNIRSYPCGLCKETGKVTARRLANVERAKKAEATAQTNKRIARQEFQEANSALIEGLSRASEWSEFAASLMQSFSQYGKLSEKQIAAGQSMLDKMAAKKAAKKAEAEKSGKAVDISAIETLFETAKGNGLKRPVFRALDGVQISMAPATGRNAGALYVKENGEYAGKIVGGKFIATSAASEKVMPRIVEIAADPLGQATLFGQRTGSCGCCGRELTNHASIDAGIGPICAMKWGM